jgi:hypothetical protein
MQCGQDSDCNPGSAAAVLGTFYGLSGIPSKFTSGLSMTSTFSGTSYTVNDVMTISESMARQILALTGGSTSGSGTNETWTIPWPAATPLILEQWPTNANTPPALTASLVTQSNFTVTLSATATDSDGISGYQWFFGDMTFTNGANVTHTYRLPGTYSIICYVADNIGNTSYRVLSVDVPNTNRPVLLGMAATASNQVRVTYSKAVEPASATNRLNYAISPGVTVLGAAFGADAKTIVLTTSPLATGITYTGTANGVNDLTTPPNTIAPNSQATFILLPFTVWHSYGAVLSAGSPQGRVFDEPGAVAATLEFYESTNNSGVGRGGLFTTFNPGPHPESFNAVGSYWANGGGSAYPYAGKSLVARSAAEANAPLPLGVMDLQLHPPQNDHLVVAAWVAPFAGTYRLTDLGARRRDPEGNSVTYRVFDQNKVLVASLQAVNNTAWNTDTNVYWLGRLTAGDRVYFSVDRDGDFGWDATEVAWTLSAQAESDSGGSLSCSCAVAPAAVDLTAEGVVDWTHWGLSSASSFDHKSGVAARIGNYHVIGSTNAGRYANNPNTYSWQDGTPTASNPGTATGVYIAGQAGAGFELAVPADTTVRTLKLYVGVRSAQGKLEVSLSDGSALAWTDNSVQNASGTSNALYTIHFRAASAGHTLVVKWTSQTLFNPASGNVTLQAATLALTSLDAWRASYFSASELADPNISGDTADPDGDGIPNLLEYALNGNPKVANASIRPQPSILADHLTLNYTRRKAATDVTYELQASSELTGGWTPAGMVEQVLLDDGGLQTVRASDPAWVSANARRFLKLKVGKQ